MALNDTKVQLFNYICGVGDDSKHALASEQTKLEVKNWLKTHADQLIVLFKDRDGKPIGGRIDLQKKICYRYLSTGLCYAPKGYCPRWHICKRFIEGDCDGECDLSHDFHDKSNQKNTTRAGLENFPSQLVRNIVAYSLPQVCLLYCKSECRASACPYLHICSSVVRKAACECSMSHNLQDQHNKKILEKYYFSDPTWFKSERRIDFVLCNILYPVAQKVCKSSKDLYQACRKGEMLTSELPVASTPGSKVAPKLPTSGKDDNAPAPSNPNDNKLRKPIEKKALALHNKEEFVLSKCLESNSSSPDSKSIPAFGTSRDGASIISPHGAKRKKTDSLQACQTKVFHSNQALQDSKSYMQMRTLKLGAVIHPETETTRDRLQTEHTKSLEGKVSKMSSNVMSGNKDVQVQTSLVSNPSTADNVGGACIRNYSTPYHWSSMASNANYTRVKLEPDSSEFTEVETLFGKTMKDGKVIDSVERVQNPFLWETYCRKKDHMVALVMQKNPHITESEIIQKSEKRLFHGTTSNVVEAICKQNFDWRVCGESGTKYGEGSYFATNACYSHSYTRRDSKGSRYMFLVRVLIGSYTNGKRGYRRPPSKDPSDPASDLYDSCVDDENKPKIFVIFDSGQFYPEYIIKYFTLEEIIITDNTRRFSTNSSTCRALSHSGSINKKPVAELRRLKGNKANHRWSPSTSSGASAAPAILASTFHQPVAEPRLSQDQKANLCSSSTSFDASRVLSNSASNSPVIAPRRSQDHKANLCSSSISFDASRILSNSASNSPVIAPRRSQDHKASPCIASTSLNANLWSPCTSFSADGVLSYSASDLQQPVIPPRRLQDQNANRWGPSSSFTSNEAFSFSASNLPVVVPRRAQDQNANPRSPDTTCSADGALSFPTSNWQQSITASGSSQDDTVDSKKSSDNSTTSRSNALYMEKRKGSQSKNCLIL